jgi:hypothetical protein
MQERQRQLLSIQDSWERQVAESNNKSISDLLAKLTGQNFGSNTLRWEQWWNQNKSRILKASPASPQT